MLCSRPKTMVVCVPQCVPTGRHLLTMMMHETTTWRIEVKNRLMIAHGGIITLTSITFTVRCALPGHVPHFLDRLAGFKSAYGDDNDATLAGIYISAKFLTLLPQPFGAAGQHSDFVWCM